MVRLKSTISLLIPLSVLILNFQSANSDIVRDVYDIVTLTEDIIQGVAKAWKIVDATIDFSKIPLAFLDKTERKLFNKIAVTNEKLDYLEEEVETLGATSLDRILQETEEAVKLELRLNDLKNDFARLDNSYQLFRQYTNNTEKFERFTLKDYAKSVVSHNNPQSVVNTIAEISDLMVPQETDFVLNTGVLHSLTKSMKQPNGEFMCNQMQSPQQVLNNLYTKIAVVELKVYTMEQFAYMILRMYSEGNFTKESTLLHNGFLTRRNTTLKAFRKAMNAVSRELWMCDPENHEEGKTFEKLTGVMQGYISNEVNLNRNGKCWEDCPDYNYVKQSRQDSCQPNCKVRDVCNGHVMKCISADSELMICPANQTSYRRYDFVQYDSGRVLGHKTTCRSKPVTLSGWTDWFFYCPYCFCLCDQQGIRSDRYINLRPSFSDFKTNRVVTGLRFVKKNRIIHLTVQEGELLPQGNINASTLNWVEPQNYHITDKRVYAGQDFHIITFENRAVDLKNVEVDDGYVMTGVRFKLIGKHVNLEIFTTKFNYSTGELINPEHSSMWKDNINIPEKSDEIKLTNPDIPTNSKQPSIPLSEDKHFILFQNSDIYRDAAQTTVPFFDAQKVESERPVPLAGAGLFYKGRKFYGGYIAPKLITYDFSKYLGVSRKK